MRRIGTEAEIARRKKRTASIISVFLLVILVASTLGYAFVYGGGDSATQNQFDDGKTVSFEGQTFRLSYTSEEISEIPVEVENGLDDYVNSPVYFSIENGAIYTEIFSFLSRYSGKISPACYGPCEQNIPEKDCTGDEMIVWKDSAENKVYQEGSCVFVDGDLRSASAFVYYLMRT